MDYALILGVLAVVVLIFIMLKQRSKEKASVKNNQSSTRRVSNNNDAEEQADSDVWVSQVNTSVSDADQSWEWDTNNTDLSTASVSAQEVDPLTEYQVYKQFGYEDKAAASLASYLNNLKSDAPEKLVSELAGLCLNIGDVDLLSSTLERHASVLSQTALAEYIKAGLGLDSNHLGLRVLAESKLNWGMHEVARQIGEQTGLDVSDSDGSPYNMSSTVEVTVNNDGREVKRLTKRSPLIIDALKLDYQNSDVNEFAAHLWKLYYSLGSNGRQVKERMLGWGYSLGQHEVFDNLEKAPTEQQIREIGLKQGYLQAASRQAKIKYRELVQRNSSLLNESTSPAELALKEVESLLMYGQLDQAISTLEQAVLQYPQESQLYIMLFDLYERSEDWVRLERFLRLLREREANLPEEVVLAISQLQQRIHRNSNK